MMSGTVESARQAAQDFPIPVTVVDGRNNSMGLGWQVVAAARAREAGGNLDAMLTAAEKVRKGMVYYVTLDTIEYLSRGGRIAEATTFLGSILHIKPLIYVRPETGTVAPSMPARSRKGAIEGLVKEFFRHFTRSQVLHVAVLHNNAPEEAQQLCEVVQREYSPKELFVTITSPILGAHTGPKAIALVGYADTPA
jgi:DegV family protein with EDD domain